MTEKRFLLTEQFNGLQGVNFVKDDCADVDTYYTVDGTVDLLNEFAEENEQLKSRVEYLERKIDRERTSYQKQHEKWEEEIQKENEQLKSKNRGLQSELQIFKEDATHSNLQINKLADENEQLKKDATTLIYANQDYRQQNQNLQKQLDYIQNSINNAIKHQKTELGVKVLQEIIVDYNEWMLGHKEAKE